MPAPVDPDGRATAAGTVLVALAGADVGTVRVLPAADPVDGTLPRRPTAETAAALAAAGLSCDG